MALYLWGVLLLGFLLGAFWAGRDRLDENEQCGCGEDGCSGLEDHLR